MVFEKLKIQFPKIRFSESLKNHCTLRVGGRADLFYELTNIEELPQLITLAEENSIPYVFVGRGANVLFTDKGFRGLIIKNLTDEVSVKDTEITADSGVLLSQLIRLSIDSNLTGLEPLYGIPGTIGGAIYGNAGASGTEIGSFVKTLTIFNVSDGVKEINGSDIEFSYRFSSLQKTKELIMRATLKLQEGKTKKSKELMQKIDEIRRNKQPIGFTAGSFFKNPSPFKPAGYLLDQAGLKGMCIGDAQISPKHANFFMNIGNATAAEILQLAKLAKKKVKKHFGLELEMEVKLIGEQ